MATTFARSRGPDKLPNGISRNGDSRDELAFCLPAETRSLAGFRAWTLSDEFPEFGRFTFIDGEVFVDMSKEEITAHLLAKTEIGRALAQICRDEKIGRTMVDGCYVVNEAANVANVPDVVFVTYESIKSGRVALTDGASDPEQKVEVVGSPDLVVEIVSNSSVHKDLRRLRTAYHAAGILEYWLIDARGSGISFQILTHRRAGYVTVPHRQGWSKSRVFGRSFQLSRKRDEVGWWDYTLESRED